MRKCAFYFALLASILSVAESNIFSASVESTMRIIGGETAEPGDYPYYVQTRICGGALVAPDIVLTAAHCGNIKNQQVNVGAYGFRSATNDSEARFCEQWIPDPRYDTLNPNPPNNYDFALCKLDQPVAKRMENNTDTNDARRIRLELNRDNSIPVDGEILEVMGMGYDKFNNTVKQFPDFLQYISLPSVNNTVCENIWDVPKYQDRFDTEVVFDEQIQLCAGYVGVEGRDVCQGDSGSPLVQRTIQPDGTIVDIHVGLVSYGTLCAQGLPSVYARTSSGIDWIETTICDTLQSVAPFCNMSENSNNNDNDLSLDSDCDGHLLTIEVTTDANGYETSWTIFEDSTNTKILERKYLLNNYKNEHTLCLDNSKSERYTWTIRDEGADGMCTPKGCGSYSVRLDGKLLFSGDGTNFQSSHTEIFCINASSKSPSDFSCQIAPTPNPTPNPPNICDECCRCKRLGRSLRKVSNTAACFRKCNSRQKQKVFLLERKLKPNRCYVFCRKSKLPKFRRAIRRFCQQEEYCGRD